MTSMEFLDSSDEEVFDDVLATIGETSSSPIPPPHPALAAATEHDDEVEEPVYIEESEILTGCLHSLPPQPSTVVRVYLSSNYSDFTLEKNRLMLEAVPEVRRYCRARGLEFQLIDLRWGAREDIITDHQLINMCFEELEKCRTSHGPYMAILLGDRYGSRPYPSKIAADEYQILYDAGKAECGKDVLTLDDWYVKDENAAVSCYNLQHVVSRFPFFYDETEVNINRRKKDQEEWAAINANLTKIFRAAADHALKEGTITERQAQKYTQSVLEDEITRGIEGTRNVGLKVVCFNRNFKDFQPTDRGGKKYLDLDGSALDEEARGLVVKLKQKVTESLPESNLCTYNLQWLAPGLSQIDNEHQEYMERFISDFIDQMKRLIDANIKAKTEVQNFMPFTQEVLRHSWQTQMYAANVLYERKVAKADLRRQLFRTWSANHSERQLVPGEEESDTTETEYSDEEFDFPQEEEEDQEGDGDAEAEDANKTEDGEAAEGDGDKDGDKDGEANDEQNGNQTATEGADTDENKNENSNEDIQNGNEETKKEDIENENQESTTNEKEAESEDAKKDGASDDKKDKSGDDDGGDADVEDNDEETGDGEEKPGGGDDAGGDKDAAAGEENGGGVVEMTNEEKAQDLMEKLNAWMNRKPEDETPPVMSETESSDDDEGILFVSKGLQDQNVDDKYPDHVLITSVAPKKDEVSTSEALFAELQHRGLKRYSKPMILYGPTACGKTTLMAAMALDIDSWLEHEPVKIIRFLGTTKHTLTISDILIGICAQIWLAYDVWMPIDLQIGKDFTRLSIYFRNLLQKIKTKTRPLVIMLDAVEKLDDRDGAHAMKWLPKQLPRNVHMILSISDGPCLNNAQNYMDDYDRFVPLSHDLIDKMIVQVIERWRHKTKKQLTGHQVNFLVTRIKNEKLLLMMKMGLELAFIWTSYTPKSEMFLCATFSDTCERLLNDLEKSFGKPVMSQVMGYLSSTLYGLTPLELEDLLSCDEDILQDAFIYHAPPSEQVLRIPQLFWKRLHNELKLYLTTCRRNARTLMTWFHPEFAGYVKNRYLTPESTELEFHRRLADYFLGRLAERKHGTIELGKPRKKYEINNRNLLTQPLLFSGMKQSIYNMRYMSELPYHLVLSFRYSDFVETLCRRYEWLYHKCQVDSMRAVLDDLKFALKHIPTAIANLESDEKEKAAQLDTHAEEIKVLHDVLAIRADVTQHNPRSLATQLLGQLMGRADLAIGLQMLRKQADMWCESIELPLIVPQSQCLPFPGTVLKKVLDANLVKPTDNYMIENKVALSSDNKTLYVIDRQKSGDFLLRFDLTKDGKLLRCDHLPNMDVKRLTLTAGDKLLHLEIYDKRDKFDTKYHHHILHTNTLEDERMLPPGPEIEVLTISSTGTYAVIRLASSMELPIALRPIAHVLNLKTGDKMPLHHQKYTEVRLALISQDETFVVLCTCSGTLSYARDTGKQKNRWDESRKGSSYNHNTPDALMKTTHLLKTNQLLTRGFDVSMSKVMFRRDLKTGDTMYEMKGYYFQIDVIAVNREQTLAACGTVTGPAKAGDTKKCAVIWDVEWGKLLAKVGRGVGSKAGSIFSCLGFCGLHDEYVLTNCSDGEPNMTLWYIGTRTNPVSVGIPVHELVVHNMPVVNIELVGRDLLITAALDNKIALWDLRKIYKRCESRLKGNVKTQKALEAFRNKCLQEPDKPCTTGDGMMVATSMTLSRNGEIGVVGTRDGWVIFYDMNTLKITKHERVAIRKPVNLMLTTTSGRYIVTAATDLRSWTPEGECKHIFTVACRDRVDSIDERQDILVAGFSGRECCGMVWDLITGLRLRRLEGLYGFSRVAITSDATRVVGVFFDFPMIFNIQSGEPMNSSQMETAEYDCTCLSVSPDDKFICCASTDGSVKVMEVKTGMYNLRLLHQSPVHEAKFTPDSEVVLTAAFKSVHLWSVVDGTLINTLSHHEDIVHQISFAVNGRFLVTCGKDRQLIVWDFKEKDDVRPITNFYAHCSLAVMAVALDLSVIIFGPENINYLGVLEPNPALKMVVGDTSFLGLNWEPVRYLREEVMGHDDTW